MNRPIRDKNQQHASNQPRPIEPHASVLARLVSGLFEQTGNCPLIGLVRLLVRQSARPQHGQIDSIIYKQIRPSPARDSAPSRLWATLLSGPSADRRRFVALAKSSHIKVKCSGARGTAHGNYRVRASEPVSPSATNPFFAGAVKAQSCG